MFDLAPNPALAIAVEFFDAHGASLLHAAELLGGPVAKGHLCNVIDGLRNRRVGPRQLLREVRRLSALLHLDHAADPEREESGFFAMIDPCDLVVDDLCRLAEAVDSFCEALAAFQEAPAPRRAA